MVSKNKNINDAVWRAINRRESFGARACNITKLVKVTLSNLSTNIDMLYWQYDQAMTDRI
ncbi:MAG: hypothetical protein MUO55_04810 [Candidatus Atribacteria bacterium]|nr:hypothetical protein [Candidatus Atribacteria bacterium]